VLDSFTLYLVIPKIDHPGLNVKAQGGPQARNFVKSLASLPHRIPLAKLGAREMAEVSVEGLRRAIRNLHGCESTWVEAVEVKEAFEGQPVWEGRVQVFDLQGHPKATRCYAWSHAVDDSEKRRFVVVLHQPPVDSPAAAVRAAIVQEHRERQS
jgi:hypothetical protein